MLTTSKIKTLEPRARRYMVSDGAGLFLEVRTSGRMSWRFRYTLNRRPAMVNLGRYPQIGIAEARQKRSELAKGVAEGYSPIEQRRATQRAKEREQTVKEFCERYLRDIVSRRRRNPATIRRYFEREIWPAIGNKAITQVELADLRRLIFMKREQGYLQAALAIRNLLKRLWDYAIVCGAAESNLLAAIPPKFIADTKSRNRALSVDEIGAFLRALNRARIAKRSKIALLLILMTMTRKSELRLARWEHINLERAEWTIPPENTKGDEPLLVFLSHQAVALLEQLAPPSERTGCLFPMKHSREIPMHAHTLNIALYGVRSGIPHFTVHDLRRTAATHLSEKEYPKDVIEKAMNHKIAGVRGVYNRAQYATQRREMLQAWADWLDEVREKC